jgi:hypothetical protein
MKMLPGGCRTSVGQHDGKGDGYSTPGCIDGIGICRGGTFYWTKRAAD